MAAPNETVSIVVPTLNRPTMVGGLLDALSRQTYPAHEVIVVDGADVDDTRTEDVVKNRLADGSMPIRYIRFRPPSTARQRNVGIDLATGAFLVFVDDDIRPAEDFVETLLDVFRADAAGEVGGIFGFIENQNFDQNTAARYRWWKKLRLLSTFEPGRYDFRTGYPIGMYGQPPFSGTRPVDFMGTSCAMWRSVVFADGLRFDEFFVGYGVLEDAHLALRAGRHWQLLQCGDARCTHLRAPGGRDNSRAMGRMFVTNYHYVFRTIAGPLTVGQRLRFWRFQVFEIGRMLASAARTRRVSDLRNVYGRLEGICAVARGSG